MNNKKLSVAVPSFIFISSLFITISTYFVNYEESFFIESVICSILTFFIVFLTEVACVNSNEIFIIGSVSLNFVLFTLLSCQLADGSFTIIESSLLDLPLLPSTVPFTIISGLNTLLSIAFCKLLFNVNRDIQLKRKGKKRNLLEESSKNSVH